MPRKKQAAYRPAVQTIESLPAVRCWNLFGKVDCRPYYVSTRYHRIKLRKAWVYVVGPDSWKRSTLINHELHANNKRLKVQIFCLAKGKKSKKWKPGKKFNIDPKLLIEVYEDYL